MPGPEGKTFLEALLTASKNIGAWLLVYTLFAMLSDAPLVDAGSSPHATIRSHLPLAAVFSNKTR